LNLLALRKFESTWEIGYNVGASLRNKKVNKLALNLIERGNQTSGTIDARPEVKQPCVAELTFLG
jgi:hypothetical protein